ncbi:MAG: HEAT repeat domain-containing protein [Pirellulales bacterium]|nr:HEAT repeat domain-containing protein [Pirellulales bacterium]
MSDHLAATIDVLATTENEAAVDVLIAALDSRWQMIRDKALWALLTRRNAAGHREVIRRLHQLDAAGQAAVAQCRGRMGRALRDALLSPDEQTCANGCQVAVWLDEFDLIPTLLNALGDPFNPNGPRLGATLLRLIDIFWDELSAASDDGQRRRDPRMIRASLLTALESSVSRFGQHRRREPIEAFLTLADCANLALRQILDDPYDPAFVVMVDVLSKSSRPGVIQLLLGGLEEPGVCSTMLSVIGKRYDLPFVRLLMTRIGRAPAEAVSRNLKRIESIAWLANAPAVLVELDGDGQAAAVQFVVRSNVSRRQAFAVIEHLLIYGKLEGRRAAAAALAEFSGVEANDLAVRALADDDAIVQAEVIPRLRGRGIPGVLERLLELLDSPHEIVRRAIRESLEEFSFDRFVGIFDLLDESARQHTGQLVKRIDPTTVPRLRGEFHSELRTRRLRALRIVVVLDVLEEVERDVIAVLRRDPDHLVRIEAVDVLSQSPSRAAGRALRRALSDRSTAVREAARRALEERAAAENPETSLP